jgi:hypothetical protein
MFLFVGSVAYIRCAIRFCLVALYKCLSLLSRSSLSCLLIVFFMLHFIYIQYQKCSCDCTLFGIANGRQVVVIRHQGCISRSSITSTTRACQTATTRIWCHDYVLLHRWSSSSCNLSQSCTYIICALLVFVRCIDLLSQRCVYSRALLFIVARFQLGGIARSCRVPGGKSFTHDTCVRTG